MALESSLDPFRHFRPIPPDLILILILLASLFLPIFSPSLPEIPAVAFFGESVKTPCLKGCEVKLCGRKERSGQKDCQVRSLGRSQARSNEVMALKRSDVFFDSTVVRRIWWKKATNGATAWTKSIEGRMTFERRCHHSQDLRKESWQWDGGGNHNLCGSGDLVVGWDCSLTVRRRRPPYGYHLLTADKFSTLPCVVGSKLFIKGFLRRNWFAQTFLILPIQQPQMDTSSKGDKSNVKGAKLMADGIRSFKQVLCSETSTNIQSESDAEISRSQKVKGKNVLAAEAKPCEGEENLLRSKLEQPVIGSEGPSRLGKAKRPEKAKLDMKAFLDKLPQVKQKIISLRDTSLFGFLLGENVELVKLKLKLKQEWGVRGDLFIHPRSNGWLEFRFTNAGEKTKVWEARPYHVQGKLLILREWKSSFDPTSESVAKVDLWVRIHKLPIQYVSLDVLSTIMEVNGLGRVIRLDNFTEKLRKLKYVRMCMEIDLSTLDDDHIVVPDEFANEQVYRVFFEDFPMGCGTCGEMDHTFAECPNNNEKKETVTVALPKKGMWKRKLKEEAAGSSQKIFPSASEKGQEEELKKILNPHTLRSGIKVVYISDSSASEQGSDQLPGKTDMAAELMETEKSKEGVEKKTKQGKTKTKEVELKKGASAMQQSVKTGAKASKEGENSGLAYNNQRKEGINKEIVRAEGDDLSWDKEEEQWMEESNKEYGDYTKEELCALLGVELASIDNEGAVHEEGARNSSEAGSVTLKLNKLEVKKNSEMSKTESAKRKAEDEEEDITSGHAKVQGEPTKKTKLTEKNPRI